MHLRICTIYECDSEASSPACKPLICNAQRNLNLRANLAGVRACSFINSLLLRNLSRSHSPSKDQATKCEPWQRFFDAAQEASPRFSGRGCWFGSRSGPNRLSWGIVQLEAWRSGLGERWKEGKVNDLDGTARPRLSLISPASVPPNRRRSPDVARHHSNLAGQMPHGKDGAE